MYNLLKLEELDYFDTPLLQQNQWLIQNDKNYFLKYSKNNLFVAIKGKKNDGNKFVAQSFKKKASLAIVNKIQNKLKISIKLIVFKIHIDQS